MKFYIQKEGTEIRSYPCIVLRSDNWDDYSLKTTFLLSYFENSITERFIGETKILYRNLLVQDGARDAWTLTYLPTEFEELSNDFVSLGQAEDFYKNFKIIFHDESIDILRALRDCGIDRSFLNNFKNRGVHDSLFRSISAEKLLNDARKIVLSDNQEEAFHFTFEFTPLYGNDNEQSIVFNFDSKNKYFPNRIFCLVGENGVGKTQIINQLPKYIIENQIIFNRIIHLTNSYFDKGVQIPDTVYPDYRYFGIINQTEGDTIEVITKEKQILELKGVLNKIIKRYQKEIDARLIQDSFRDIKKLFYRINFDEIFEFFDLNSSTNSDEERDFPLFFSDFELLSSGESILLSNLIKILSCIAFNSIFLIDEPEIHLHPNFITSYMEYIYKILNRFDSFALIATHSTFVVRELKANCVYVVRRTRDDVCEITPVARQTFGTNAMSLAINIFDNDEIQPYFRKKLKNMVDSGNYTEEQVYQFFEINENYKLDIGVKMRIHSLFEDL